MYKKAFILAGAAVLIAGGGFNTIMAAETVPAKPAEAPADQASLIKELAQVPKLNLGANSWNGATQIYRIETAEAFKKMGGNDPFAFDFTAYDLVVVRGALGCAHGKVEFTTDKKTISFSVAVTDRCTHMTRQLHHFPYCQAFQVSKNAQIAQTVASGKKTGVGQVNPEKADILKQKLQDPNTTHLNLEGLGLADADLAQLKEFKNLTHLYLQDNQISDEGLAQLSHMTTLFQLYLSNNTGITDAGLKHLQGIVGSRLQILSVNNTQITNAGLENLNKWIAGRPGEKPHCQIMHSVVIPQVSK